MYWEDTPSKIDFILQQEDVTLEKILDEADVLQECISNNDLLIKFLTRDDSMVRMLNMMINEPNDSKNIMENYKYANTICEILTHDRNVFSNLIATNEKYLLILWSFLDKSCLDELNKLNEEDKKKIVDSPTLQQSSQDYRESTEVSTKNEETPHSKSTENEDQKENKDEHSNDQQKDTDENQQDDRPSEQQKESASSLNIVEEKNSVDESSSSPLSPIDRPLNPLLASFFTKVFMYMFTHETELLLDFLVKRNHPNDLVSVILRHINASAIMDLICKTWEHVNVLKLNPSDLHNGTSSPQSQEKSNNNHLKFNNLLIENGFVEKLIDVFKHGHLESEQQNIANLIADIVRIKRDILNVNPSKDQQEMLDKFEFESEQTVRALLNNMFECKTKNSIVNGLKIIQVLLQYNLQMQNLINQQEAQLSSMNIRNNSDNQTDDIESMPKFLKQASTNLLAMNDEQMTRFMQPQLISPVGAEGEHLQRCVRNVSKTLNERLDDFVRLLVDTTNSVPIKSTVGLIEKPLGLIRLEVIHLFVALFATSDYNIMQKCSQLNVLQILTDLFFEYLLNNQLHKYYEQIIRYIFQNYRNFKIIYDKHQANNVHRQQEESNDSNEEKQSQEQDGNSTATKQDEKVSHFIDLYEISKRLVEQILKDCHLIEKILDCFSQEKVPTKSFELKEQEQIDNNKKDDNTTSKESNCNTEKTNDMITESEQNKVEQSVEVEMKLENNGDDAKVEETIDGEKQDETLAPDSKLEQQSTDDEQTVTKKPKLISRPGYMGHLRLIANILKERCNEQLLKDCGLEELIPQWNEFNDGPLKKLNALVRTQLVPETKQTMSQSIRDEEAFLAYHHELTNEPTLPDDTQLLPNDFGQNPFGSNISEQLKLSNEILDNSETELKSLNDFEKQHPTISIGTMNAIFEFCKKFGNPVDDDDDEEESPWLDKSIKNKPNAFLTQVIQEDFATFDSKTEPVLQMSNVNNVVSFPDDFEDCFTNIDSINNGGGRNKNSDRSTSDLFMENPWNMLDQEQHSIANSSNNNDNKIVNDDNWANFMNEDPFAGSAQSLEIFHSSPTNNTKTTTNTGTSNEEPQKFDVVSTTAANSSNDNGTSETSQNNDQDQMMAIDDVKGQIN